MKELRIKDIERMIYLIRGQRVMMDSDLAVLYEVDTKRLLEQVKRNKERFPADFMFECDLSDLASLRSQFATANPTSSWNNKRRTLPILFTESGVAMISTVLTSERAIQVNISIIRIFVKLRSFLALDLSVSEKVISLEKNTNKLFKIVFERLDNIEEVISPRLSPKRKKIGLKD